MENIFSFKRRAASKFPDMHDLSILSRIFKISCFENFDLNLKLEEGYLMGQH